MELREHQISAIDLLRRSIATGHKRPLLFAPCSFGKTICAAHIADLAGQKGNKTLFLVHRRLLANQTKEKFDAYGLHSSIIMAGYETDFTAPVMITTHQTYSRRLQLCSPEANRFFHDAACLIVDEAHLGISPSFKKIYDFYQGKVIIGLTGSPARADQRGLGEVFDDIVEAVGVQELTDAGYLAPARYYSPFTVNSSGIPIVAGDFSKRHMQKKFNTKALNGNVVSNWIRLGEGRPTIVFTSGVKHSKGLQAEFSRMGIPAAHLDSYSSDEERQDVLSAFRAGDITVVTNCQLFTEGYDADFVEVICLARSTLSYPLYVQMVGRGQRIFDGKADFAVLDFGGNVNRFGFISDPVIWSLSGKERAWKKPELKEKEKKNLTCNMCGLVFPAQRKCPECMTEIQDYGKKMEVVEADLKLVGGKRAKENFTMDDKRRWWAMFEYERRRLGKTESWLKAQYRSKFGVWYKGMEGVAPKEPDQVVKNWLIYQRVKYFKAREKQAAAQ